MCIFKIGCFHPIFFGVNTVQTIQYTERLGPESWTFSIEIRIALFSLPQKRFFFLNPENHILSFKLDLFSSQVKGKLSGLNKIVLTTLDNCITLNFQKGVQIYSTYCAMCNVHVRSSPAFVYRYYVCILCILKEFKN